MGGGGEYGRTCATRDDEPRPVWTVCVYYCSTYYKAVRVGGGGGGTIEDMCYERLRAETCVD
jgi:hypothetical protein